MLMPMKVEKGPLVTNVQELRMCEDGLFLEYTDGRLSDAFCIDNPIKASHDDIFAQDWLNRALKDFKVYKRQYIHREPVFSDSIDNSLDDLLSSFALEYADNEYHEADVMENFLRKLKEEFNIERRRSNV